MIQDEREARGTLWPVAIATALAFVPAAHAQDDEEPVELDKVTVEEVSVTATRIATRLDRLAARVTVVTREEIEQYNHQTLFDVLRTVPGIQAVQSGPAGSITSVFSRGTNSKHTLALFDGIRLNDPSAPNGQYNFGQDTLADVARVEVVRGPVSSVYGSDAIGGVVNLIPRVGGKTAFDPYFEASYGEFDTFRGMAGGAGSSGDFSYSVTAEYFETEGFDEVPDRFDEQTGDEDGAEFLTLTGVGRWQLSDTLAIGGLLRYRAAESDFDTFSGGPSGFQRADDPDLRIRTDDYFVWRLGPEFTLADGAFTSKLQVGQVLNERETENGGVVTDSAEGERLFLDWINSWTIDDVNDTVLTFGAQFQNEEIDVPLSFNDPLKVDEDWYAAFGVLQTRAFDLVDVTGSLRVDDFENFGTEVTYNLGGVFNAEVISTRFLASIGTSFKAPTLTERFGVNPFNIGNPDLEPEEGDSWEVGFETTLPLGQRDSGLIFGISYFDTEIEQLIEYSFADLQNQNVGNAEIDGYEVFVDVAPTLWFDASVSYTYTDAINADSGDRLLRRPEDSWVVSANLRPMDPLTIALQWVSVGERADVNYSDDGFFAGTGGEIEGYDTTSVTASYDLGNGLLVFVNGVNVFDEDYEQPEAYRGQPRAFTVGVRGRF